MAPQKGAVVGMILKLKSKREDEVAKARVQLKWAVGHTCGVAAAGSTDEGSPEKGESRGSERVACLTRRAG